jgi:hypothetical protein
MHRNLAGCVLMLISVMACATLPKPGPQVEGKLQVANAALDGLSTDLTAFYGSLETLIQDIKALYDHPGWTDMEAIIGPALQDVEHEEELPDSLGQKESLHDWTERWGDSGEGLFSRYLSLVDRCSISEARRIGLIGRLASLQARYLETIFMELSAQRYAEAKAIFSTVEALGKWEDELNSYILNALGLYDVKPSR